MYNLIKKALLERLIVKKNNQNPEATVNEELATSTQLVESLDELELFTVFNNQQMRSFIEKAAKESMLNAIEREGFIELWNAICFDGYGYGNNIWNLKPGRFVIKEEAGIKIEFIKTMSEHIDEDFAPGRIMFSIKTQEGQLIFKQDDRNKEVFIVFSSKIISPRLINAFKNLEIKVLELKIIGNENSVNDNLQIERSRKRI